MAVAGNVFAADEDVSYFNPYAGLKGGYAFLGKRDNIKYKGGFAGAVEMGVSYDAWRLGLELGYKSNKIKEITGASVYGVKDLKDTEFPAAIAALAIRQGEGFLNGYKVEVMGKDDGASSWMMRASKISKINTLTGMMNVYYDYAMTDVWSVYVGLGLGVAKVSYTLEKNEKPIDTAEHSRLNANKLAAATVTAIKNNLGKGDFLKTEHSKTVFAWQVMAGVGYEFNENWKLTLGYKMFNTAKVKVMGNKKIKTPFNHTFEAGLNYTF